MNINSAAWRDYLKKLLLEADIDLDDNQFKLLEIFSVELLAWNQKTNLTAITDPAEVAEKHMVDSLIPAKQIQLLLPTKEISLLDIGAGGGFPGIPLKIFMPFLQMVMVDSARKKVNFLKYAIRSLQLNGIDAVHARIEDLSGQSEFAGRFDVVISRAFTALDRFLAIAVPFVNTGGLIIAMKGKEVENELDAIKTKETSPDMYDIGGFPLRLDLKYYTLPDSGSQRSLVILRRL